MNWGLFSAALETNWPWLLQGLGKTLLLAGTVTISGLVAGVLVFYLSLSRSWLVRWITNGYISFFIGMPLIVLLFLIYYGLPGTGIKLSPWTVAVLGFTMNVAAYNARYLKSAYNALDQSELEAGRAQGFSEWQLFSWVTLPQAIRLSVPSLTNQAILNVKDSSVTFLIQYTEFFARIQELANESFQYLKSYLLAGLVYLLLVSLLVIVARRLERKALSSMLPA